MNIKKFINLFKFWNKQHITNISYNFVEGENVIFDDGYNKFDVIIQGIWGDMVTIIYEDGFKLNTNINNLIKK